MERFTAEDAKGCVVIRGSWRCEVKKRRGQGRVALLEQTLKWERSDKDRQAGVIGM